MGTSDTFPHRILHLLVAASAVIVLGCRMCVERTPDAVGSAIAQFRDNPPQPAELDQRIVALRQAIAAHRRDQRVVVLHTYVGVMLRDKDRSGREAARYMNRLESEYEGKLSEPGVFEFFRVLGDTYRHHLRDVPAAIDLYERVLRRLPRGSPGNESERRAWDYARITLCVELGDLHLAARKKDYAERYYREVLAYPHLGMEDRTMFRKFSEKYAQAGHGLILVLWDDLPRLLRLEFYPAHQDLWEAQRTAIESRLLMLHNGAHRAAPDPIR